MVQGDDYYSVLCRLNSCEMAAGCGCARCIPGAVRPPIEECDRYPLSVEPVRNVVARQGFDKMKTTSRERAPFVIEIETAEGGTEHLLAKAVSDACCPPAAQATCCDPEAKASCCGDDTSAGCGC